MSKTWFTSDLHFNHARIIEMCSRPYTDASHMEEAFVANWNDRVADGDTVYVLGDFAMHPRDEIPRILGRLKGQIVLIAGNHDHRKTLGHFPVVHTKLDVDIDGHRVQLVHNPADATPAEDQIVLCGHVHSRWAKVRRGGVVAADDTQDHAYKAAAFTTTTDYYNVGVDVRGYRPVTLAEILR